MIPAWRLIAEGYPGTCGWLIAVSTCPQPRSPWRDRPLVPHIMLGVVYSAPLCILILRPPLRSAATTLVCVSLAADRKLADDGKSNCFSMSSNDFSLSLQGQNSREFVRGQKPRSKRADFRTISDSQRRGGDNCSK